MSNILITGAAGNIGVVLAEHLNGKHNLTLVDVDFSDIPKDIVGDAKLLNVDLSKPENWEGLLEGIDYVIHLAGDPRPDAEFYDTLLDLNYKVPHNLFEEAIKDNNNVKRIIFASSVHAIGGYPLNVQVKTSDYPRPNDLYGVSKVYMEALASFHAYMHNQPSIGIRIGGFNSDITVDGSDAQELSQHLSKRDMCHLIDRCLEADMTRPFLLVNGVSNNRFPRMDISQAHFDIGYTPQDNAFLMYGDGAYPFTEEEEMDMDPKDE